MVNISYKALWSLLMKNDPVKILIDQPIKLKLNVI